MLSRFWPQLQSLQQMFYSCMTKSSTKTRKFKMLLRELFLLSVSLLKVAHCSSDIYKKLQDGATITPLDIQEKTDKENKYDFIKFVVTFCFSSQLPTPPSIYHDKFCRGIMYCTILCTKEENCIGTKAEGGSCYLYKDGLAELP